MTAPESDLLLEGALSHSVSQERPGCFTLTPKSTTDADWVLFQDIVRQIERAAARGELRCMLHAVEDHAEPGFDLVFVIAPAVEAEVR